MVIAVVAVLASLWAGWATYTTKKAEALTAGMALNIKAEAAENKDRKLFAHLYSLHALTKLLRDNGPKYWQEALVRAQANLVPVPAFIGYHADNVNGVAFSSNGRLFASASKDKTIGIWDALTGKQLQTLKGHTERTHSVSFSSDGRLLASSSRDKTIVIWDMHTGNRQ